MTVTGCESPISKHFSMDTMMYNSIAVRMLASVCQPVPKEDINGLLQFLRKDNELQKIFFAAI